MNEWIKKYLKFYNASLTKNKKRGDIIVSKLNGKKTNLKVSINLETFYNVMSTKYRDNNKLTVFISEDRDLVSISSDDYEKLEKLMSKYGGWIDDSTIFKHKYTLQVFEFNIIDELKIDATI